MKLSQMPNPVMRVAFFSVVVLGTFAIAAAVVFHTEIPKGAYELLFVMVGGLMREIASIGEWFRSSIMRQDDLE